VELLCGKEGKNILFYNSLRKKRTFDFALIPKRALFPTM